MEQKNSQELDQKKFSNLVYDPSLINAGDTGVLADLIEKYPYAQLLRSFYSRSLVDSQPTSFEKELNKAALYFPDRAILRTIIEDPDSMKSKMRALGFNGQIINEIADPIQIEEDNAGGETTIDEHVLIEEEQIEIFEEIEEAAQDLSHASKEKIA
uniref:hypothetical protein n=1 Tax=Daejeonella sp. TaxID=2805397 RepID=UPI003983898F